MVFNKEKKFEEPNLETTKSFEDMKRQYLKVDNEYLTDESKYMIMNMSDSSFCQFVIWDFVHSIITNKIFKIRMNLTIFSWVLYFSSMLAYIIAKYRNLEEVVLDRACIIVNSIMCTCLAFTIAISFFTYKVRKEVLKDLDNVNKATELLKISVKEELNNKEV